MVEITNFRNGAVLNHYNGIESEDGLLINVKGIASSRATVKVNGILAKKNDRNFSCLVNLTQKINQIKVEASDAYGDFSQTITVVWDKASYKRMTFFFDDCTFFLRAIALNRPKSIFDEMFLGRLKAIHDKYNTNFLLNLFYHDDHHDFSISDFPTDYKAEFQANSSWLKLSFHAKSEFPDRPYQSASAQDIAADFDLVKNEVIRFAGVDSFMAPCVLHWAMTNPENFCALKERGTNCLTGGFQGSISRIGEKHDFKVTDIGYHYEQDITQYLVSNYYYYDSMFDMLLSTNLLCCNYSNIESIRKRFESLKVNPRDALTIMSHEQYSYSDYFNYIPDHLDRVEEACRLAYEFGYKPAWYSEGIFGNKAWDN
jgi:hypothetical protein